MRSDSSAGTPPPLSATTTWTASAAVGRALEMAAGPADQTRDGGRALVRIRAAALRLGLAEPRHSGDDDDPAARAGRIHGIQKQIHEDLLERRRIAEHGRKAIRRRRPPRCTGRSTPCERSSSTARAATAARSTGSRLASRGRA